MKRPSARSLWLPAFATLAAFTVLTTLGAWQLQRKAWKEELIGKIEARAYGEPDPLPPPSEWAHWSAKRDEYRRVRVTGAFLHEDETTVHGLMSAQRGQPVQGFYVLTPLRLRDGSSVIVNRGFVPTELRGAVRRAEGQLRGEVTMTGLMRAPEQHRLFVPANDPARNEWFTRDVGEIARSKGLDRIAPFLIDADATPNPGGWPKGGQTRLVIPNDHLQYALTWFGLALTLLGVFASTLR